MRCLISLSLLGFLSAIPVSIQARPPAREAETSVQAAIEQEIQGNSASREELLKQAVEQQPEQELARWLQGQVQLGKAWVPFAEVAGQLESDRRLQEYRQRRQLIRDTRDEHLELANWCREQRLELQESAHLTRALELSPDSDDPALRKRLGFVMVRGDWITRQELVELNELSGDLQRAGREWSTRFKALRRKLNSTSFATRKQAREELKQVTDPLALPALEAEFSGAGLSEAKLMVEVMAAMPSFRASEFLARQAVLNQWEAVRTQATEHLQQRLPETWAPVLLGTLQTPVKSQTSLTMGMGGVSYSQVFYNETQGREQLFLLESNTIFQQMGQPVRMPAGQSRFRLNDRGIRTADAGLTDRAIEDAQLEALLKAYSGDRLQEEANDQITTWNQKVCTVLAAGTQLDLPAEPEPWWNWWRDYNQIEEAGKTRIYRRQYDFQTQRVPQMRYQCECLVAGTPIWTERGPLPVEELQLGDLVLSRDPRSGELTYQPVLKQTLRARTETFRVEVEGDAFQATGGHSFWVSGRGWTKTRDLLPGMTLHTAGTPVKVTAVAPAEQRDTWNLVVAGFHTYFVGQSGLLSHDVTIPQPVDQKVPGQQVNHQAE